jgi:hypothetical protein
MKLKPLQQCDKGVPEISQNNFVRRCTHCSVVVSSSLVPVGPLAFEEFDIL